ncbi:hypothetical protein K438DRAFT_1831655 [Mycena galopus ATCC 62051]|nr:hypothetical protein K438DRAFT_1831655 [Mycena galopus ATCC 62051]
MDMSDKWKWVAINLMDHTIPRLETVLDQMKPVIATFEASIMGINDALDKWKWVAINLTDHTIPTLEAVLNQIKPVITKFEAPITGINDALDKWKWVAINLTDHTIPRLEAVLDRIKPAIATFEVAAVMLIYWFIITLVIMLIGLYKFDKHYRQKSYSTSNLDYLRTQYGTTIDIMTRTYSNLMKLHSERVRRHGVGADAGKTNVLLIGVNEAVEAYIRYEHDLVSDRALQGLLPLGRPFAFRTMEDALHAVNDYCASEEKAPKTLFVFLLISSRDPLAWGPHEHSPFQVPKSLQHHCYAIVGTGENGALAHKLSRSSKDYNGEPLMTSLPLGQQVARVSF